jgi:UDP-GlcNAc:undecaprenyl-phosphate GlcNAc-1-phosphate transferase
MLKIIIIVLFSFLISFLATLPTIKLAKKFSLVDDVNKRKHPAHTHQGIIPRAGGIPIYLSILLTTLIFLPLNKILVGILIGSFFILIMGIADDYFDLSPYLRFFLNLLTVTVVISFGLGIPYISHPLGGVIRLDTMVIKFAFWGEHKFLLLANLFSIFWITALMNFVNWSKGVDGQMPGFVSIASLFLGILAYRFVAHDISIQVVVLLCFIVAAAFAGFLPWNFYPQKIMPGYGGGALAGFFLGVLSILSWGKLGTLMLVLSIPLTDAIYVILRRLTNFKSPFVGDAGHFHHRLLKIGWGRRRIAVFYWLVSFLFGLASLFFHGIKKVLLLLIVIISLAVFIGITNRVKKPCFRIKLYLC